MKKNMKRMIKLTTCCLGIMGFMVCGCTITTGDGKKGKEEITVTGAEGKEYTSYRSACSKGDFDAAREFVEKMNNTKGYYASDIKEAEEYVFNEEIQYLASLNEEQANNRIIMLLNQQKIEGFEPAEGALIGNNEYETHIEDPDDGSDGLKNFGKYIDWCGKHNTRCTSILNTAISCGNQNLAQKVLHSFRKDPEMLLKNKHKEDETDSGYFYDVYAHYTNASKDAAQGKYDEAVASGAFN